MFVLKRQYYVPSCHVDAPLAYHLCTTLSSLCSLVGCCKTKSSVERCCQWVFCPSADWRKTTQTHCGVFSSIGSVSYPHCLFTPVLFWAVMLAIILSWPGPVVCLRYIYSITLHTRTHAHTHICLPTYQVLSLLNNSINVLEIWMRLLCMWTSVSQCSQCPSANLQDRKEDKIQRTFQLFGRKNSAKGSKKGQEKQTMMEPDVDLTPMHIPCILGDISRPQIYKKKYIKKKKIDHVVRWLFKRKEENNKQIKYIFLLLFCHTHKKGRISLYSSFAISEVWCPRVFVLLLS